jgi:hypothetical protein
LKSCLWVTIGAIFLLALAVFMVLTSTASLLITLGVLSALAYGLFRLVVTGSKDVHNPRPGR